MNTGDTVRDTAGASYEVGRFLGRGSWGRAYAARNAATGEQVVIKRALQAGDLGGDEKLAATCREILAEQGALAEGQRTTALPALQARIPDGDSSALVFAWAGVPLAERATAAASTSDLLELAVRAIDALKALTSVIPFHGNLTAGNLLIDDRGQVFVTDPITPTFRRHQAKLYAAAGLPDHQLAPELRGLTPPLPLSVPADTWGLCLQLTRALTIGQERFGALPVDGLDKPRRVALKDQLLNRLRKEPSNPAFHSRLVDKLVSLLNRALSQETSPTPPYRFRHLDELGKRFAEIRTLVHPTITSLGRLNWGLRAGADAFQTDEDARFTINVACSTGVEGRDEIGTGIALFDSESGERLRDVHCAYSVDKHPSGRFRFLFKLPELRPGAYRVRVAFTIRESGDEPTTAEDKFHVRPAPGYVPPRSTPERAPIPMRREPEEAAVSVTEPGVRTPRMAPPTSRVVRPGDGERHAGRPVESMEEAPTVPIQAATPTPIAPFRPTNLAVPPVQADAPRVAQPERLSRPDTMPPRRSSPGRTSSPGRSSSPGRPSTPGRASSPGVRRSTPGVRPSAPRPVAPGGRPSAPGVRASSPGFRDAPTTVDPIRTSTPGVRPTAAGPARRPAPGPRHVPSQEPAPGPADMPQVDPSFPVMGPWVDIDVAEPTQSLDFPEVPAQRDVHETAHTPSEGGDDDLGPVGAFIMRMMDLIRGDAYYMFIAVAIVLIFVLGVALILFSPTD